MFKTTLAVNTALTLTILVATLPNRSGNAEETGNSVTVLHEGYLQPIKGREPMPGVVDSGARHVGGTIVLVRGGGITLVADPGMVRNDALILAALEKEGVATDDVTHVFISHHHPDHTMNIALFANAALVDFWAKYSGDLWEDHGDDYELAAGIRVIQTPGHTEEDASLVVDTPEGTYVLTHAWPFSQINSSPDPLAWDQKALDQSRARILKIADWIIPGHGNVVPNPERATQ